MARHSNTLIFLSFIVALVCLIGELELKWTLIPLGLAVVFSVAALIVTRDGRLRRHGLWRFLSIALILVLVAIN